MLWRHTRRAKTNSLQFQVVLAQTKAAKEQLEAEAPGKKFKFQRVLTGFLLEKLYPDDVTKTIRQRIETYYPELAPNLSVESLEVVRTFSLSLPVSVSQQLLRTWANAWTTSYRMHETQLLYCIFGCVGCLDTQQHYLFVPPFGMLSTLLSANVLSMVFSPIFVLLICLCFLRRVWS